MLTYTKQPRSLPAIEKANIENTETVTIQPVKTGNSNQDEIKKNLISIQFELNNLYVKLKKINSKLIYHKKGGKQ